MVTCGFHVSTSCCGSSACRLTFENTVSCCHWARIRNTNAAGQDNATSSPMLLHAGGSVTTQPASLRICFLCLVHHSGEQATSRKLLLPQPAAFPHPAPTFRMPSLPAPGTYFTRPCFGPKLEVICRNFFHPSSPLPLSPPTFVCIKPISQSMQLIDPRNLVLYYSLIRAIRLLKWR